MPADPVAMEEQHEQLEEHPARHDDSNEAAANMLKGQTPILTPVTPPQLNSTVYKCVTEFLTKYEVSLDRKKTQLSQKFPFVWDTKWELDGELALLFVVGCSTNYIF
ncbi:unnamed protein product (mitochondrion) [Plasmodiophora brassicae]|uniref:Uncharacterized protein n=1 Tax=Plasmodiophora brassicae TaxID=37360 RepID=A0A0G4J1Z6_PLABS|nr:hypothetical protein PBRA_001922 [Plasmodiophora brassicae]SPR01345.1 unnamed protein product [Plasmodiophora brassicae]